MGATSEQAAVLRNEWRSDPRWTGIRRDYTAEDVMRLRGSADRGHARARRDASRLWDELHGGEAAGWSQPVQLAQSGSDGAAAAFDEMKSAIDTGAAGTTFGDELSPGERRGQLDERVLVPTAEHVEALASARLAADVLDVPALVIARTSAHTASLITSPADERDHEFLTGERTAAGFWRVRPSLYACVMRGLAFAPYADLLCLETLAPDLAAARAFATIIHSQYPGKLLAYHCSPELSGQAHPGDAGFRQELATLGYCLQSAWRPGSAKSAPHAAAMAFARHR